VTGSSVLLSQQVGMFPIALSVGCPRETAIGIVTFDEMRLELLSQRLQIVEQCIIRWIMGQAGLVADIEQAPDTMVLGGRAPQPLPPDRGHLPKRFRQLQPPKRSHVARQR
jgi:hypothetical protein